MAAIITAEMKKRFIDEFKADADSASVRYYIGISRSEDWNDSDTAPTPVNTEREQRLFRHGLQSVKKVSDYSFVIPRVNWTSGTIYAAYNDAVEAHPTVPYYAMDASNQVYVCLRQGINAAGVAQPSTVAPSGTGNASFTTADGYAWKFLYTVGTLDAAAYKSANFIPVKLQGATDSSSPSTDTQQKTVQDAATAGREIVGFSLDSGGAGYSSNPTVTISGDGTGAAASAVQSGGTIVSLTIDDSASTLKMGTGYNYASIVLSGGGSPTTIATGKVIFGPKAGFGADPTDDLRARAIMFNAKPVGEEGGEFIVGNSFRQIGLIRNPKKAQTADSDFTGDDGNALRRLAMPTITTAFTQRAVITGGTSGAKAFVNKTDSDEIWYHQTESTGFIEFAEAETITDTAGGSGTSQATGTDGDAFAYVEPLVDKYSGDLMYIENRAAVTRAADQTEDIKVIVEI